MQQLVIDLGATDKEGHPVTDLTAADFEVKEDGESRTVTKAELDRRPLKVGLVLDTSSTMATVFQSDIAPAAAALIAALPAGTTYDVWTTGNRPSEVVSGSSDPAEINARIKQVPVMGDNALLDTIKLAANAPVTPDQRFAVAILTSAVVGGTASGDVEMAVRSISKRPTFVSLEMATGNGPRGISEALRTLAAYTAGVFVETLSTASAVNQVPHLVDAINSQYRIAWEPKKDPRSAKLEFKVKRKNVRLVRSGRLSTTW
jgi:hypothetical protein